MWDAEKNHIEYCYIGTMPSLTFESSFCESVEQFPSSKSISLKKYLNVGLETFYWWGILLWIIWFCIQAGKQIKEYLRGYPMILEEI